MKQDLTIPHGALDGIEAFLRVAERRSFSAAAADLGVSPSAISQTIKTLEARVGAPLFMRTTRSVGLTQAGEMFLERAAPAFAGLADAYEAARNLGNRPAGRLRINLMRGAVQPMFEPIIAGFVDAYPEIELEIYADDALADLSAGGFDAGVRMGESLDADVMAEPMAKKMVETGELELVLTDYADATSGLFLYYPSRKQVMPKLRAFIDYVREYLPDQIGA